ncbi:MAG: hypothetical protein DHS20C09_11960 [marine bacterium B5-7]|nr:MAG: hypothetical protein DHS20C09_11960 [marine bacterium B5-7]
MTKQLFSYFGVFLVILGLYLISNQIERESNIVNAISIDCCTDEQLQSFKLRMVKTACYGACPVYELEVGATGKLRVIGISNVSFNKIQHNLTQKQLSELGKMVFAAGFFQVSDIYDYDGSGCVRTATDQSATIWDISIGDLTNSVTLYKGCEGAPSSLLSLEREIVSRYEIETDT